MRHPKKSNTTARATQGHLDIVLCFCLPLMTSFSPSLCGNIWTSPLQLLIWWSFQMKVRTCVTQRNSMIPSYSMIPAILWSQLFDDPQLFHDPKLFDDPQLFDDQLEVWKYPKVYGDTIIYDGLVLINAINAIKNTLPSPPSILGPVGGGGDDGIELLVRHS